MPRASPTRVARAILELKIAPPALGLPRIVNSSLTIRIAAPWDAAAIALLSHDEIEHGLPYAGARVG